MPITSAEMEALFTGPGSWWERSQLNMQGQAGAAQSQLDLGMAALLEKDALEDWMRSRETTASTLGALPLVGSAAEAGYRTGMGRDVPESKFFQGTMKDYGRHQISSLLQSLFGAGESALAVYLASTLGGDGEEPEFGVDVGPGIDTELSPGTKPRYNWMQRLLSPGEIPEYKFHPWFDEQQGLSYQLGDF